MEICREQQLDALLEGLLVQGVCQGVAAGMGAGVVYFTKDLIFQSIAYKGITRSDARGHAVGADSLFDLASLTKPLATALSLLYLVDQGKLAFHDQLGDLLELKMPVEKKGIRLDALLSHASGLPAYNPYFLDFQPVPSRKNLDALIARILREPLIREPATKAEYSDLGYILLGSVLEQQTGQTLDTCFRQYFTLPLHIEDLIFFGGVHRRRALPTSRFLATEDCPWRQRIMVGEVHDEHCWLVGGVSGHAGLFASLEGVLTLATRLFACWQGYDQAFPISRSLLEIALQPIDQRGTWCLGFDSPTPGASSSGRFLSANSVGHLGYTGTSLWMDPRRGLIMVLLTNRVHPTRDNRKITDYRPWFHDAIVGWYDQCFRGLPCSNQAPNLE